MLGPRATLASAVSPTDQLREQGHSGQGMETGPGNAPARHASDENGGLES
jgi:hypothetical protein